MARITKRKTNEQLLRELLKDIDGTIYPALLRERIVTVMKMTIADIKKNPKAWEKQFISPSLFIELDKIVEKHLGFKD